MVLIISQVCYVLSDKLVLLFKQSCPFGIAIEDVLKNGNVISLGLLLDLQDMDVFGEVLDLQTTDGVDQARLTDTVSSNKTVLASFDESNGSVLKAEQVTGSDGDGIDGNVLVEARAFIVAALRLGDIVLVFIEGVHRGVESDGGLLLFLGHCVIVGLNWAILRLLGCLDGLLSSHVTFHGGGDGVVRLLKSADFVLGLFVVIL